MQMRRRIQVSLITLISLIGLIVPQAFADTVYLTSGETVKGLVVEEHHDRIVFSTYKGEIQIPKISIEQIFFDNEEQNYIYLGDKAFDEGDLGLALGFYQKAYQINPELEKTKMVFLRLIDAANRKKLNIRPQDAAAKLREQLGITVEKAGDKIKVVSVAEKSSAEGAGITVGDFILSAWDASLEFMDASSAGNIMVGAPATPIKLNIEKTIVLPVQTASWLRKIFHLTQFSDFGFNLSLRPTGLIVVRITPQALAEKNGLKLMDEVTYINGESTRYMPASLVRKRIFQGNLNRVTLTIRREVILMRSE